MDLKKIKQAREELHQLVQLVSMVPRSLLAPDPTDISASLLWDNTRRALMCQAVGDVRVGLSIHGQHLLLLKKEQLQEISVIEKTEEEVLQALKNALSALGLEGERLKTERPYTLPQSVQALGQPFKAQDKAALQTLENLYDTAHQVLKATFDANDDASDIRCWPHHFDMATLLTLVPHQAPEEAKSIGFGFSPGDRGYEEPYFYLTPWPYPPTEKLYPLNPPAQWNTKGWVGAVLSANDVNENELEVALTSFFNSGLTQLKPLL